MATVKRTQDINHGTYRKKNPVFYLAPVALAVGAVFMLYGRSNADEVEATIYRNAQECIAANPTLVQACNASYESSLVEAQNTAPKYATKADCEAEFGVGACEVSQANAAENGNPAQATQSEARQGSMWMPLMMGYMMGRMSGGAYGQSPMFSSSAARSPAYNKFVDATGRTFGSTAGNRSMKVDRSAFAPKPATTQTITRGGFGQSVTRMNNASAAKATSTRSSSSSSAPARTFGG
jgi:uncharacterized protein YgiB involved in biofilm formation